jgi:hypothetical protein
MMRARVVLQLNIISEPRTGSIQTFEPREINEEGRRTARGATWKLSEVCELMYLVSVSPPLLHGPAPTPAL